MLSSEQQPVVEKSDFSALVDGEKVKFDFAYIMQHGTPGENGLMQGYLEMIGVPHSGCNAFVSAITFDKFSCKSYLKDVDFVKCRLRRRYEGLGAQPSTAGFAWAGQNIRVPRRVAHAGCG